MNFDIFEDIDLLPQYKGRVINAAKSAERNVLVSPYNATLNARVALENLCKSLIESGGYKEKKDKYGNSTLAAKINACVENGAFPKKEKAHIVQKNGNDAAHGDKGSEQLHIVNSQNVHKAMNSVRSLFDIMAEVFPNQARGIKFDEYKIPFGFYEIVRAVHKCENEVIFGDYNYFVKDPKNNYYYLQVLNRNSKSSVNNDLGARSVLTGNRIKGDKGRKSYLLDVYYPSNLMAESDRDYIAYSVYSDSKLLSEIKPGTLSKKHIIQIAIDILEVLKELKNIGDGIHLRNIQPGNVIVTPNGDDYIANVVNMETAKINNYGATVYGSMGPVVKYNLFLPEIVRTGKESPNIQWEKVDVYSVAVIMVYCMDKSAVKNIIDTDSLYGFFGDEIGEALEDVLGSSINEVDGIDAFKEKLDNALKEFQ